jgi:hypothetical protein
MFVPPTPLADPLSAVMTRSAPVVTTIVLPAAELLVSLVSGTPAAVGPDPVDSQLGNGRDHVRIGLHMQPLSVRSSGVRFDFDQHLALGVST